MLAFLFHIPNKSAYRVSKRLERAVLLGVQVMKSSKKSMTGKLNEKTPRGRPRQCWIDSESEIISINMDKKCKLKTTKIGGNKEWLEEAAAVLNRS